MKDLTRTRKKDKLLRELEEMPLIERACKKSGIGRSTYYRWCEADRAFYYQAEYAISKGRDKLNDFVESKLLENIQSNNQSAIQYWLSNNSRVYRSTGSTWHKRDKQLKQEELEKHEEILELLDLDEAMKLYGVNSELLAKAIQVVIKGELSWMIRNPDE